MSHHSHHHLHHHRRQYHDSHANQSGRLSYDDRDDPSERDRGFNHGHANDRDSDRRRTRDGSFSPRRYSNHDDSRHDVWGRRPADRLSPHGRRTERSRSPHHPSAGSRNRMTSSRSPSPESRYHRRSPTRDYDRSSGRKQYFDRDASNPIRYDEDGARYYGEPSRDIMLEGIGDMTDDDIQTELESHNVEGLNTVTVIRDRKTGQSRGFAFARFSDLTDSKRFLERFYPVLTINNTRVTIAYSKERHDAVGADDWQCGVCLLTNYPRRIACFRCGTSRADSEATGPIIPLSNVFSNDGSKDTSDTPSQFLMIRDLEANVTEEILLKGAQKLASDESAIRRVLLVRDKRSNESWRFGFVEFINVDEAKKAFDKYLPMDGGFTIKSRPVVVSYIHPGVFVPIIQPKPGIDRWTFGTSSGGGVKLAYWDDEGYCKEHLAEGARKESPQDQTGVESKTKKRTEKLSSDATDKTKKRKADTLSTKDSNPNKKIPSHLQFWQERHSELHGLDTSASKIEPAPRSSAGSESGDAPRRSYADMKRLCCYLCSRQFKTEIEVNKHERISKLHATNLLDESLVQTAEAKLQKHGIRQVDDAGDDGSGYRDRAKERRMVHSQPANPGAAKGQARAREAMVARASPEAEVKPTNRGASLLSKMGWTEGKGLGAQESGITAPIVAGMYVEGVGLGASGGKVGDVVDGAPGDVGGYSGFVERTREKARGRYEELDSKER